MEVAHVGLAQLRVQFRSLAKSPVPCRPENGRQRDGVNVKAHAEDERGDEKPVENGKPTLGASQEDRPGQRLMNRRSVVGDRHGSSQKRWREGKQRGHKLRGAQCCCPSEGDG